MSINKGHVDENHNYIYTCGNCNGAGYVVDSKTGLDQSCHHCYALDYPALLIAFTTARGERYYALLKAILSIKGKAIHDRAMEIRASRDGKLLIADLCHLLMEFQFPRNRMKPLAEWLEESRVCPAGMYDRLLDRGFKVNKFLEELGYKAEGIE